MNGVQFVSGVEAALHDPWACALFNVELSGALIEVAEDRLEEIDPEERPVVAAALQELREKTYETRRRILAAEAAAAARLAIARDSLEGPT